jgi:folate-dependent phosphoribosylglycinamide formyltransferase PurN
LKAPFYKAFLSKGSIEGNMRVAAIATYGLENKYLLLQVALQNDLVAVFYPTAQQRSVYNRMLSLGQKCRSQGAVHIALHQLTKGPASIGWRGRDRLRQAQQKFFSDAADVYDQVVASRAAYVNNINSDTFCQHMKDLAPDVVVCSGGPIYKKPLIEACKVMLNYHTGISPVYNGADTIWWAYANGHPQFCGGTLMLMNESVDGGNILAHYFTGNEPSDDPATLFCKAIQGGARLYNEFLADLRDGKSFQQLKQAKPFFYYRSDDWTIHQSLLVQRRLRACERNGKTLPEDTERYWACSSPEVASQFFQNRIMHSVLYDK